MRVLKAAEGEVRDLAFSPDGRFLAAAVTYHGVYLWDLTSHPATAVRLHGDHRACRGLHFSTESREVSWVSPGVRRVVHLSSRELQDQPFVLTHRNSNLQHCATGERLVSHHTYPDDCLIGWRMSEDGWVQSWKRSTKDIAVERPALSADGRYFAMLTRPTIEKQWFVDPLRVEIRDTASAAVRLTAEFPYPNSVNSLLFSPDARQLVGFKDMTLIAWSLAEGMHEVGSPQLVRNDNRKHFTAMAYHPAGRHLYATSNDATVHIFDTATWERTERFRWQLGSLKAVAVSPDGLLAAAGTDKGDVVIWDVDV